MLNAQSLFFAKVWLSADKELAVPLVALWQYSLQRGNARADESRAFSTYFNLDGWFFPSE